MDDFTLDVLTVDVRDKLMTVTSTTPHLQRVQRRSICIIPIACGLCPILPAEDQHLSSRAAFQQADAGKPLPFDDNAFDGLICIDAVNHLPDRRRVFSEWARVLKPGGRLVFTDPIVVTGPLTGDEMRTRSSIGFFLFVPGGINEQLLTDCGFTVVAVEDRTDNMADMADRWYRARQNRENELRKVEGGESFEGQQSFLEVASTIAGERRLSRFAYLAVCR